MKTKKQHDINIKIEQYQKASHSSLQAEGFFVGWRTKPGSHTLKRILESSYASFIAYDENTQNIIGFINIISDGVFSCYIPLLEVLPEYQHQGIGSALVDRALKLTGEKFYMVDLCCDQDMLKFYEKFSMKSHTACIKRNYHVLEG